MLAYRSHKMFCIHTYSARPVKKVIPRIEVAAGMCAGYIFVMPRKKATIFETFVDAALV